MPEAAGKSVPEAAGTTAPAAAPGAAEQSAPTAAQSAPDAGSGDFQLGFMSPTMLQNALKYAHNNAVLLDATFGTNHQKLSLYTALAMDAHGNGLPLFHVLTHGSTQARMFEILSAWQAHMESQLPGFRPSCMMVDDAIAEINAIK